MMTGKNIRLSASARREQEDYEERLLWAKASRYDALQACETPAERTLLEEIHRQVPVEGIARDGGYFGVYPQKLLDRSGLPRNEAGDALFGLLLRQELELSRNR